jgi:hypothetical protein
MPASSAKERPQRGPTPRRVLAGLLCLILLLAGGLHAGHADEAHGLALTLEIAEAGSACDGCATAHVHGIALSCSPVHACTMSATLAGLATLSPLPEAPVGLGDARLHRGLDTAPRPHPPKLSAAA